MFEENNANPQANEGADNTAEQMDTEIDLDALAQEKDVEKLRTQLRTTVEQKKHWREKARTFENDPRLKVEEKPVVQPKPTKADASAELEEAIEDRLSTRQKYPDMTDDEVARAKSLSKAEGKRFSEVVNDPYFQAYMRTNREAAAKAKAIPGPSNRGGNGAGYKTEDLQDSSKLADMDMDTFEKLSNDAAKNTKKGVIQRK